MLILEKHTFSLRTRRFIMYVYPYNTCCSILIDIPSDLFDKSVMRKIVLDDDYEDESNLSPINSRLDTRNRTTSDTRSARS